MPVRLGRNVGLLLGLALAFDGFGSMLIVAFCGAVGYVVKEAASEELVKAIRLALDGGTYLVWLRNSFLYSVTSAVFSSKASTSAPLRK